MPLLTCKTLKPKINRTKVHAWPSWRSLYTIIYRGVCISTWLAHIVQCNFKLINMLIIKNSYEITDMMVYYTRLVHWSNSAAYIAVFMHNWFLVTWSAYTGVMLCMCYGRGGAKCLAESIQYWWDFFFPNSDFVGICMCCVPLLLLKSRLSV